MIKKIAALTTAGALMMASAAPMFAYGGHHGSSLTVSQGAGISNSAMALSDTGANTQNNANGGNRGDRYIGTGAASSLANAGVTANQVTFSLGGFGGLSFLGGSHHSSGPAVTVDQEAMVENSAGAQSFTGGNTQDNGGTSGHSHHRRLNTGARTIVSGNASSTANANVLVNVVTDGSLL